METNERSQDINGIDWTGACSSSFINKDNLPRIYRRWVSVTISAAGMDPSITCEKLPSWGLITKHRCKQLTQTSREQIDRTLMRLFTPFGFLLCLCDNVLQTTRNVITHTRSCIDQKRGAPLCCKCQWNTSKRLTIAWHSAQRAAKSDHRSRITCPMTEIKFKDTFSHGYQLWSLFSILHKLQQH